jgi:hypothetical protein
MKKLAFPLACVLSIYSANAANIIFVSFHATDAPSANAANAAYGFNTTGEAPDKGFTDLLRNAGHTVTRMLTTGTPNLATLNAADLVIISRSVPSGDYQQDQETRDWNGVTAPMMILGGFVIRGGNAGGSRLGLMAGEATIDTTGNVTLTATAPAHPIFQGITLGTGNTLSYATDVNNPAGTLQRGISVVPGATAAGGLTLGTTVVGGNPGLVIGEWQAGATTADNTTTSPATFPTPDTLGGHRMVFLAGSREHAATPTSSEIAGIMDLTPEGRQLLLNAVNYMAVPEPSTYALFGLGGMALLLRRRKA